MKGKESLKQKFIRLGFCFKESRSSIVPQHNNNTRYTYFQGELVERVDLIEIVENEVEQ